MICRVSELSRSQRAILTQNIQGRFRKYLLHVDVEVHNADLFLYLQGKACGSEPIRNKLPKPPWHFLTYWILTSHQMRCQRCVLQRYRASAGLLCLRKGSSVLERALSCSIVPVWISLTSSRGI